VLSRPEKGHAVGIVPGGASEALEAFPGKHRLILANRKVGRKMLCNFKIVLNCFSFTGLHQTGHQTRVISTNIICNIIPFIYSSL
jgi:hypothetical protein